MLLCLIFGDIPASQVKTEGRFSFWGTRGEDVELAAAQDTESLRPETERAGLFEFDNAS